MTNMECSKLRYATDNRFPYEARRMGFDVAGPNYGAWLVREHNGRAWLFGQMSAAHGDRVVVESRWTDLNLKVMGGIR